MENNRILDNLWTQFVIDKELKVLEIVNPDSRLFFGKCPVLGNLITEMVGKEDARELEIITSGIFRAQKEKRNTCFEYLSTYDENNQIYVSVYVNYCDNETLCLYLAALDTNDSQKAKNVAKQESDIMLQTIYENLPIGIEIYDRTGWLIEMNPYEMKTMGIRDKKEVLGINIFENPNLPVWVKPKLMAGEDVAFTVLYDFSLVKSYYKSSKRAPRQLEVTVTVMRDVAGEIEKFLVLSQDITERLRLQKNYEELYNQNETILNSLPVGVAIYGNDGVIQYVNNSCCRIFGIDQETYMNNIVDIQENPILPPELKNAVHLGIPVHTHFPYNFNVKPQAGDNETSCSNVSQIECNGTPVFSIDGEFESYVFIIDDVTERVRNEEELRQSKHKTELAIQAADITIWEFDVHRKLFFSENDPFNNYKYSQALDMSVYIDTTHIEERLSVKKVIDRMLEGENFTFALESRIVFPGKTDWEYCTVNGAPYEFDNDGKVIKYVGMRKNNTILQKRKLLQERILNSIPLPIHIKDIEDKFRYVFCNDESKRMFGTSEEKTAYDVMDVQEVERIQKTDLEVFTTGKPYLGLERIVLKDGRSYDTIVRKSIIHDGDKRLLLNVRWDQSLQNDLQRRAKVLTLTLENMNAYTWFFEPQKKLISFGEGFDKICLDAQKIDSLEKFAGFVHPDDREYFLSTITTLLNQENGEWAVEYRADLNNDGSYIWWETRGLLETSTLNDEPYPYMFGMSICIESHKQTELTLLKNKEELDALIKQNELVLNNTNSGLAYIASDYIVQWENISKCSASLSYEAYKKGELCYKSAHNRTSPCPDCVLARAFKSNQMEQIKFTLDTNHTVEVFATPVFSNDVFDGIVIRVDNVTERERIFEELRQAKALAEQSDKLKSAFLANMSHEIRTPLNAIVGFSDLLISCTEEEERTKYMQIINTNNELLLKLINDILDLSKIEAGSVELKYEEFDLSEYFDDLMVSMKQRVINPHVRLITENPYPSCKVNLDRNRVAQILTNYVTNAIKYTPKGFIEVGYEYTGEGIYFYVKDSGIGISEEKKAKVFHRFEKLDEFAQGTGLGLSICKAITESMGGRVGFDSNFGEGSCFWAILPCEAEFETKGIVEGMMLPTEGVITEGMESDVCDRKTILVAEDIPSNYLLVSAILQKDYKLLHAVNGKQATEMLKENDVDLVLMDMKMPVMDGLAATAEIRELNNEIPIIALTAHAFDADREAALKAGCNDYLVKPIDKVRLMTVLQKYSSVRTKKTDPE